MIALRFTETMTGHVAMGEDDPGRGFDEARRQGVTLSLRLTLSTRDLDAFLPSPERLLDVEGELWYPPLGGRRPVRGTVGQLVDVEGDKRRKSMPYRLDLTDATGRPLVLSAVKDVVDDPGLDSWRDTTTLVVRIAEPEGDVLAAGIVRIGFLAFLRQFPSYRISGGSLPARLLAFPRFYGSFMAKLWEVYGLHRGGAR